MKALLNDNSLFHEILILPTCLLLLHRFAGEGGVRFLCTTSVRLCEEKSGVASSNQNAKPNGNKESESTETPLLNEQIVEVDSQCIVMAKESKENSKPDDGITAQSQPTAVTEQHTQVKADTAKSMKGSLLELLGGMKVEVTNKRKVKAVKFRQSKQPIPTSNPEAMESTISAIQEAAVETTTQR